MLIRITDPADDRLGDYTHLTDVALRSKHEPAKGLYIAESSNVIRRALEAGHRPRSFLMAEKWLESMAPVIAAAPGCEGAADGGEQVPVFVAEEPVLRAITGFHLHRGALAAMHRPPLAGVRELLEGARGGAGARRVAILEDIVDHTNVGAMFRSAAGLGVDAVLVTPRCADPLYRRSVRVSMGTVFQVPWTRLTSWPGAIDEAPRRRLHGRGAGAERRLGQPRRLRRLAGRHRAGLEDRPGARHRGRRARPHDRRGGRRRRAHPHGRRRRLAQRRGRVGGGVLGDPPGVVPTRP